jgi:hypothetical protein
MVPHGELRAPAVLAHARLTIVSSDSHRLHEELIAAGGIIREGRLERWNVGQVTEFLDRAGNVQAPESVRTRLTALWPQLKGSVVSALEARGRDRNDSIRKQLADRAEDEKAKLATVFRELEAGIRVELGRAPDAQLPLFTDSERDQAQRNHDFLITRLKEIPAELVREIEAIRQRYENPQPRLFPVAVTFLVPEGLA